jgi:hypothetical protein
MPNADPQYKTDSHRLMSKGVVARFVADAPPENTYLSLKNLESRIENALSSRYGTMAITVDPVAKVNRPMADLNVHTLGRMKGIGQNYRYAGAGTNLYRRTGDTQGAYTQINSTALSGRRFSCVEYRPDQSSFPYTFFADAATMLKDNGAGVTRWGIFPPTRPATMSLSDPVRTVVNLFDSAIGAYTFVNVGAAASATRINTTMSAVATPGVQAVTPASMADVLPGMDVIIDSGNPNQETVMIMDITATTFTANFTKTHAAATTVTGSFIQGTVAAATVATVSINGLALNLAQLPGSLTAGDDDVMNFYINISDPSQVQEIRLLFDVGDGSFTKDYYLKSISPDTIQGLVSKQQTAVATVPVQAVDQAVGVTDGRALGIEADQVTQPDQTIIEVQPAPLTTGLSRWTRVQVNRGDFVKVGLADLPGHDWAKVVGWQVSIQTTTTGTLTFGLDDLFLYGGSGPDSFGGVAYDYRVTYYNATTGAESNPSQVILPDTTYLLPRRQPIKISWIASPDTQVTHVRIYRRGGTLPSAWYKVGEVAIGTTTFLDTLSDTIAVQQRTLEIDNDPPVTSTLKVPVSTTLGTSVTAGSAQTVTPASMTNIVLNQYVTIDQGTAQEETVLVESPTATQFTAFFQFAHSTTSTVKAQTLPGRAMVIAAEAFGNVWLAGDPDNPHLLYYSKPQRPESFSPAATLEIGTPSDPIMAIVPVKTNLYVFTLGAIYLILGQGTPQPISLRISQGYGLTSKWGWCLVGTTIYFQSFDGIYAFYGYNDPVAISEITEWLWTNVADGPIAPLDPTKLANTVMAAKGKEVFILYTDINGVQRRINYFTTFKRFRDDSYPATAMIIERDTQNLMVAKANGMVYQDRVNDYDDGGFTAGVAVQTPIAFELQTQCLDQGVPKADKVYNEFTIDIDTNAQDVGVYLRFDNGDPATEVFLGNVNTAERDQVPFNINSGKGINSRNVQVILRGSVTSVVHVFELHIRVWTEAEFRKSWDTYWCKYGTDMWKVVKQGYFEYVAPSGITINCYIEGVLTPEYSFTLPPTTVRTATRVRFPAVKAKIWRYTGTSTAAFQFYNSSHLEIREVCSEKGYAIVNLAE